MIRSKSIDVTVAANSQALEDFVTGEASKTKRVTHIWAEQAAGLCVRGYVHQDRIVDVSLLPEAADVLQIPVDLELKEGETFKCGLAEFDGGAQTVWITVFWEES